MRQDKILAAIATPKTTEELMQMFELKRTAVADALRALRKKQLAYVCRRDWIPEHPGRGAAYYVAGIGEDAPIYKPDELRTRLPSVRFKHSKSSTAATLELIREAPRTTAELVKLTGCSDRVIGVQTRSQLAYGNIHITEWVQMTTQRGDRMCRVFAYGPGENAPRRELVKRQRAEVEEVGIWVAPVRLHSHNIAATIMKARANPMGLWGGLTR